MRLESSCNRVSVYTNLPEVNQISGLIFAISSSPSDDSFAHCSKKRPQKFSGKSC